LVSCFDSALGVLPPCILPVELSFETHHIVNFIITLSEETLMEKGLGLYTKQEDTKKAK
jgi:hypothetical protein